MTKGKYRLLSTYHMRIQHLIRSTCVAEIVNQLGYIKVTFKHFILSLISTKRVSKPFEPSIFLSLQSATFFLKQSS